MKSKFLSILLSFFVSLSATSQTQLWGVSAYGGAHGFGTIFMADSAGNNLHSVYSFDSINGTAPLGGLTYAGNGKLYGVTLLGGLHNSCVVFCYNAITGVYTNIHDFADLPLLGDDAHSAMIQASNGKLYGLCNYGGANNLGTIFEIDTLTNSYTDVFDFTSATGSVPWGRLMQASNGLLYGITNTGGANNIGTIFNFNISTHSCLPLYSFSTVTGNPLNGYLGLIQATNGKLYGMTEFGGASNGGVIFSFDIATNTYINIHDFNLTQGSSPMGTLMQASNGKLYGMTDQGGTGNGVLFSYNISTNTFIDLLNFNGTQGGRPRRALKQATDGKLYSTTYRGGINNIGVAFSFNTTTNTYTKLIDFTANTTGGYPDCDFIETPLLINQCATSSTLNISSSSCTGYTLNSQIYYTSGTYTQFLTNVQGCDSVITLNLSFGIMPTVTVNSATICTGDTVTLTANGATNYSWSTGVTPTGVNTANVSPMVTTTYTVTGTTSTGCAMAISTIIVHQTPPLPMIAWWHGFDQQIGNAAICQGDSSYFHLYQPDNYTSYTWSGPNGVVSTGYNWIVPSGTPSMTGIYYVTATLNGCSTVATFYFTVSPHPYIYPLNYSQTICSGGTAIFVPIMNPPLNNGFPSTLLTWTVTASSPNVSGYSLYGNPLSISQMLTNTGTTAETVTYTVSSFTYNGSNNCFGVNSVLFVVTVNPIPIVTVNSPTICAGQTATLTANGATTYIWSAGATSTSVNTATVSPTASTNYTVTGTTNGCSNTVINHVDVNYIPNIYLNSSATIICIGQTSDLFAYGAVNYTWSSGATSTGVSTATVAPTVTTTYTVVGTNSCGTDTAVSTVTVDTIMITPSVSIALTSGTNPECYGTSATFNATPINGGTLPIYQWYINGNSSGSNSNTFTSSSLSNNTMITCQMTSNEVCASPSIVVSDSITMTVLPVYDSIENQSICNGQMYSWNGSYYSSTGVYTANYTTINGCDSVLTLNLSVNNNINTTVATMGDTLISNQNGATYQWLDCEFGNVIIAGETNQSYIVNTNGQYAVAINLGGCVDTSSCVPFYSVGLNSTINSQQLSLTIFPNPFTSQTTITFREEQKNTTIKITDVLGKEIKTINFSGKQLILEKGEMEKGIYFVQIKDENKNTINKKIIIQ